MCPGRSGPLILDKYVIHGAKAEECCKKLVLMTPISLSEHIKSTKEDVDNKGNIIEPGRSEPGYPRTERGSVLGKKAV